MNRFQRGDMVRIKNLNELKYTEQDELSPEDVKKLGLNAVFMYYEEDGDCAVSIDQHSYKIPEWIINKDESESLISRSFRDETYQYIDRAELIKRIAYIVEKTSFNFSVSRDKNCITLKIEK